MKRPKEKSPGVLFSKVGASVTLASTFVVSSFVGLSAAFATNERLVLNDTLEAWEQQDVPLLAQAQSNILSFETADYAVRVYTQGGQTLMNVFQKANSEFPDGLLRVSGVPATFAIRQGRGAYIAAADYSGRQARYVAEVFDNRFARLVIVDGSNSLIADQDATDVSVFNVPQSELDRVGQSTVLAFQTSAYAVRVFERGGQKFMNVYNKFTGRTEVNGGAANLVLPRQAPYENAVSYVASGERDGQSVEYFARIDGTGTTVLEIFNTTGTRLFQETGTGEITVNIPEEDRQGVGIPDDERVNDAYVAAVFGDEGTLNDVRELYPEAYMDDSARQGRFINAGSFSSEEAAVIRVLELRSRGFNSRLVFRDVRYR
jgi:hypothetical protein